MWSMMTNSYARLYLRLSVHWCIVMRELSTVQALRLDTARTMLSTDPDRVMYVAGTTSAGLVTGNEGRP